MIANLLGAEAKILNLGFEWWPLHQIFSIKAEWELEK